MSLLELFHLAMNYFKILSKTQLEVTTVPTQIASCNTSLHSEYINPKVADFLACLDLVDVITDILTITLSMQWLENKGIHIKSLETFVKWLVEDVKQDIQPEAPDLPKWLSIEGRCVPLWKHTRVDSIRQKLVKKRDYIDLI